jgi:putative MFS transporter
VFRSQIANPSPEQVLTFITISYFFVSAINLGVYLYTPELYPTRARAFGVGAATAWLRLASMIGPTTVGIMIGSGLNSVFLTFGALALATAILTALLAIETKKRVLEEVSP